jgi:hypothetical protein
LPLFPPYVAFSILYSSNIKAIGSEGIQPLPLC